MARANSNTVFVIDDDATFLKGVERLLCASGFELQTFCSEAEFQTGAKYGEAFCLVLDVQLGPESGIELYRRLSNSGLAPPVIFVTGHDQDKARAMAADLGCVAYLVKPFSSETLLQALEKAREHPSSAK